MLVKPNFATKFESNALEMFIFTSFPFIFFRLPRKKFFRPSLTFAFKKQIESLKGTLVPVLLLCYNDEDKWDTIS